MVEQGTFASLMESGSYVKRLYGERASDKDDEIVTMEEPNLEATVPIAKPQVVGTAALDKRRQLGDLGVYWYFFASIGLLNCIGLLSTEAVYAFFSTFPGTSSLTRIFHLTAKLTR